MVWSPAVRVHSAIMRGVLARMHEQPIADRPAGKARNACAIHACERRQFSAEVGPGVAPGLFDRAPIFWELPVNPCSIAFALYWLDPLLVRDFAVLVGCGGVQRDAIDAGTDSPSGWFAIAAQSYTIGDAQGRLARRACELVASSLASAVPS